LDIPRLEVCNLRFPFTAGCDLKPLSKGDTLSRKVGGTIRNSSKAKGLPTYFEQINLNAAGIDVAAEVHFAAVPKGRDPEGHDVRHFGSFTSDLYALAVCLKQCNIDTVAMESTVVY
jgi:hypothetical protein